MKPNFEGSWASRNPKSVILMDFTKKYNTKQVNFQREQAGLFDSVCSFVFNELERTGGSRGGRSDLVVSDKRRDRRGYPSGCSRRHPQDKLWAAGGVSPIPLNCFFCTHSFRIRQAMVLARTSAECQGYKRMLHDLCRVCRGVSW